MFVVQSLFPRFNGTVDKPPLTSIGTIETLLPVERRRSDSPVPTLASIGVSGSRSRDPLHDQEPVNPQSLDNSRTAGLPVNSAVDDRGVHSRFDANLGAGDLFDAATTVSDVNSNLQHLLDRKKNQLQQAVVLGQRVLAQQIELEEHIRQIQEYIVGRPDEEEINHQTHVQYRELSDTILSWDAENAQLSAVFGASAKPSIPSVFAESPRETSDHKSTASQFRRTNNVTHRSINIEFAMVVGSNLLTEIGRLQTLLTEREKTIQDMKEERADLGRTLKTFEATLKQQKRNSEIDKYAEGTRNPEVTLQDLRFQSTDSLGTIDHLESEHEKQLSRARGSYESESELEELSIAPLYSESKHKFGATKAHKRAKEFIRNKSNLQLSDTLNRRKLPWSLGARNDPVASRKVKSGKESAEGLGLGGSERLELSEPIMTITHKHKTKLSKPQRRALPQLSALESRSAGPRRGGCGRRNRMGLGQSRRVHRVWKIKSRKLKNSL